MLFSNKIWGGAVGIIPGIDWVLQKFVIKKNAAKKLGQIYGIDVKFIDGKGNPINVSQKLPEYVTGSVEKEHLNNFEGKELIKDSTAYTVGNTFKVSGEAASYIGGGAAVGTGILRATATAAETTSTATSAATSAVVGIGSTGLKVVGTGLVVVGAVVGVALGGYFTSKYCEELIDKFEDYYIKNAAKINNSYKQAAQYLLTQYQKYLQNSKN